MILHVLSHLILLKLQHKHRNVTFKNKETEA